MSLGDHLFKYCGPTVNALQNLEQGHLFCQHYAAYNDPFEFWTTISTGIPDPDSEPERYLAALRAWGFDCRTVEEARHDEIIQGSVDDYFDECQNYAPPFDAMRQEMRISCFSSEADNLLMWSHYGDGLRGFCVAFDEDAITRGDTTGYILDVAYLDAPPRVDSFVYGVAHDQDWYSHVAIEETETAIKYQGKIELEGEIAMYEKSGEEALRTMRETWQHVFATKPVEWKYERERRLLVQTDKEDTTPVLRSYGRDAIKEIILGERMPGQYRARLLAMMQKRYPEIPVRTARRSAGAYTISVE
jgi:Protein of unknown function (DUF2971)